MLTLRAFQHGTSTVLCRRRYCREWRRRRCTSRCPSTTGALPWSDGFFTRSQWITPSLHGGGIGARAFVAAVRYGVGFLVHPNSLSGFVLGLCLLFGWLANFLDLHSTAGMGQDCVGHRSRLPVSCRTVDARTAVGPRARGFSALLLPLGGGYRAHPYLRILAEARRAETARLM